MVTGLAATPLIELRGAIPVGIAVYHMSPFFVLLLAFIGTCFLWG